MKRETRRILIWVLLAVIVAVIGFFLLKSAGYFKGYVLAPTYEERQLKQKHYDWSVGITPCDTCIYNGGRCIDTDGDGEDDSCELP
ncbi:hypothetical protein HY450_02265 [Candidatus Pacearchaeota archaeon]|nr:hypothetical protein [Candidatus Pacearchaeota archaeon]